MWYYIAMSEERFRVIGTVSEDSYNECNRIISYIETVKKSRNMMYACDTTYIDLFDYYNDIKSDKAKIDKQLLNHKIMLYLMCFSMFLSHWEKYIADKENECYMMLYEDAKVEEYENFPGYVISYAMRNRIQHRAIPLDSVSVVGKGDYKKDVYGYVDKNKLLEDRKFSKSQREVIMQLPEVFDFMPLITEGYESLRRIQIKLQDYEVNLHFFLDCAYVMQMRFSFRLQKNESLYLGRFLDESKNEFIWNEGRTGRFTLDTKFFDSKFCLTMLYNFMLENKALYRMFFYDGKVEGVSERGFPLLCTDSEGVTRVFCGQELVMDEGGYFQKVAETSKTTEPYEYKAIYINQGIKQEEYNDALSIFAKVLIFIPNSVLKDIVMNVKSII